MIFLSVKDDTGFSTIYRKLTKRKKDTIWYLFTEIGIFSAKS